MVTATIHKRAIMLIVAYFMALGAALAFQVGRLATAIAWHVVSLATLVLNDIRVVLIPRKGWMHLARGELGAMETSRMMGIVFSVILVVIGIVLMPLVVSQTSDLLDNTNIATYFSSSEAIYQLIPLLYAVGVLGLAGYIAVRTMRGSGSS